MKIAVLGTGVVGQTIASKLASIGHEVRMGSRTAGNEKAVAWASDNGGSEGTFADAASFAEVVINCTGGAHTLAVLASAGPENLAGKVLVDISNPLDFSDGFPPSLLPFPEGSLAEAIQAAHPEALVVKTLNTVGAAIMVDPGQIPGHHEVFVSGNDPGAKALVVGLLTAFGWLAPLDLGDISTARGVESWLPFWARLYGALGTGDFNIRIIRAEQ